MIPSRPPASRRYAHEDDDDDDFIPHAPVRDQKLTKNSAVFPVFVRDIGSRATAAFEGIDLEAKKAAVRTSAAASFPGAITIAGKEQPDDMEPEDKDTAKGPLAVYLDASSATTTSSLGVAALASASSTHINTMARVSNAHGLTKSTKKEKSGDETRVGAMAVPGLSRHDSYESASTYSGMSNGDLFEDPPQPIAEEQPLQATLVAERVTSEEEQADVEAQVKARMRNEAEDIADMVQKRIFQNTAVAVVRTPEEAAKPKRRKKTYILLVGVLVIAVAIGVGVGVALSKESPPPDPTEPFRIALVSVSGEESWNDESSPQYQALNWIAKEDPAKTSVDHTDIEIIKQRYVAAVLFFALGGDKEDGWTDPYNFLSADEICSWNKNQSLGIICNNVTNDVEMLHLSANNLVGAIPEEIEYFSNVTNIDMSYGEITGKLPSSLEQLTLLQTLDFGNCDLTGAIPDFLYTHSQLKGLSLNNNSFTGTIDPSLGESTSLQIFWVRNNKLTGPIPAAVGKYEALSSVDLGENELTGTIPEFETYSDITELYLDGNGLDGTIPSSIGKMSYLETFTVGGVNSKLTGTIPDFSGNLQYLDLKDNNLTGDISKVFSATLPDSLAFLDISGNNMSGTLPSTIGQYTALTNLGLQDINITGTIPIEIGMLTALSGFLALNLNQLTGSIPSEIGRLTKLETQLRLNNNNFTGTLPTTLGSLVSLQLMALHYNALDGPIPTELAQCQNLKALGLEANQLTGDIGPVINVLPRSLTILELDTNLLTGTIPPSIGTLTDLSFLDLGINDLNGTIPSEIGLLSNLTALGLDSNGFTGTVPASLANLPLTLLLISDNDLTGSLDAFCGIDFEGFAASTCAPVEIECACCTHCCDPNRLNCQEL